jgi:hypothetical protein
MRRVSQNLLTNVQDFELFSSKTEEKEKKIRLNKHLHVQI